MTEKLSDKIDRFINGEIERSELLKDLSIEEVAQVETQLQMIEDLKVAVELAEFKAQAKVVSFDEKPQAKVFKLNNIYKYVGIAAAVIFLIVAYSSLKNQTHPLLAEYANIKEGLPTVMSGTDNYQFDDAMTFFKQGDYKTALEKFAAIKSSGDNEQDTLDYFIGLCHFNLKGYDEAIYILDKIDINSPYRSKSIWYVLMCYVAKEDRKLVEEQLDLILSDTDHPYIDRARSFQSSWVEYKKLKYGEE